MAENDISFEKFARALAELDCDERPRATAHTSSVVDFGRWDAAQAEAHSDESPEST